jgi:hypothetical protein
MNNEPIDRMRARLEALLKANAASRCGARSKRTGKPCRGAAMPNGRCKLHGGKSTGPRTPEGLERSRRANWKHGHFSREAKAERSRVRAAMLALRDLCDSINSLLKNPRQNESSLIQFFNHESVEARMRGAFTDQGQKRRLRRLLRRR